MFDRGKDAKDLTFLYDWMRLARKPNFTLHQDLKLIFQLIAMRMMERQIDPEGTKTELLKEDLLACFSVEEENKRNKQKQLLKAFKYISGEQQDISFDQLRKHFQAEDVDSVTTDVIVKQLTEYENEKGKFDYQAFASSMY